ncbi:MAG: flagellin lysine-N-methylase [Oscillospiraceae bacterium]|nr:flagellin lysine-N-methylase [Oscillospiraceae bacterium]
MERTVWNAYRRFRCIAQACPDSCCQGWEVDVDETAAAYYRTLSGPLGDRLRQVLKTDNGASYMALENDRCPMWRQDGLCQIQAELDHDALCQVCREYPRLYMDYGDFAEWGVELSCPEAARLLFQGISAETETVPGGEEPEYDGEVMAVLRKSREEVLSFVTHTPMPANRALAVVLLYAHQVQSAIDGGEYPVFSPEKCLQSAKEYAGAGDLQPILQFFEGLEILTGQWKNRLTDPQWGTWDPMLRHLAVYLIRRYWLQAVWDFDLICRVKFTVTACILVNALGGDTEKTAQLFSKEIENDPDNREAILDAAYTSPAFTDANLLGLLELP